MNYSRLALAALGGTVASFAFGFLLAVFRPKEEMMSVMPFGFLASVIAIIVVAIIFAMTHQSGISGCARANNRTGRISSKTM